MPSNGESAGRAETDPVDTAVAQTGWECPRFEIRVLDGETGTGLPLVEFALAPPSVDPAALATRPPRTLAGRENDDVAYAVSDSAGRVALYAGDVPVTDGAPDGDRLSFRAESHGYEAASGKLAVEAGGKRTIELTRVNVAERLYRKSGQGIYRDSVQLGYAMPIEDPLLNAQVTGLDTVMSAVYDETIYWFYGDTERIGYKLGNYQSTGATSAHPADGGLDPAVGVDRDYFEDDDGFVKAMVPRPEGASNSDLFWISRVISVPDDDGEERLVARYLRTAGLGNPQGSGLLVFDDAAERFALLQVDWSLEYPAQGHGTLYADPETGAECWFFTEPTPFARVPNDFAAVQRSEAYEYFTCLEPGTDVTDDVGADLEDTAVERDERGDVVWDWKTGTEPVSQAQERRLIEADLLDPDEARLQVADVETGDDVRMHWGTVNWNDHREKWIMIFQENVSDSVLGGEIWYAEADVPTGPWTLARRIVTHDGYTFYNPNHHAFFDQDGGRYVYVEGTYTQQFSEADDPTPLYDYNQIMYRLDLEHPRLDLPLES